MNLDQLVSAFLRPISFKGKYRLSNVLIPRHGLRRAYIFGYLMQLDLSDYMQRSIYGGLYEKEDTAWLRSVIKPGMTFVDVGANVGYYTALGASLVGKSGRVIAFEPDPCAFGKLEEFVRRNGLSQVECSSMALSDEERRLTLYVPPKSYGNHNPCTARYCDDMAAKDVGATTLDRYLTQSKVDSIDLLKIDVEGHELKVLQGGEHSIREGRVKRILCEFNEKMLALAGTSAFEVYDWVRAAGYQDIDRNPHFGVAAENRHLLFNTPQAAQRKVKPVSASRRHLGNSHV